MRGLPATGPASDGVTLAATALAVAHLLPQTFLFACPLPKALPMAPRGLFSAAPVRTRPRRLGPRTGLWASQPPPPAPAASGHVPEKPGCRCPPCPSRPSLVDRQ